MRKHAVLMAAVAMVVVPAGAALAEGSWSSSMTAVRTGFDSRTWTDKNGDSAATTIALTRCKDFYTGQNLNTHLQLTKENTFTPDVNMGITYFPCSSSYKNSWGRVAAGSYHFTVMKINGTVSNSYYLNANPVSVAY